MVRHFFGITAVMLFISAGAEAQEVPVRVISEPQIQIHREFSFVAAVRELSSGSLVVVDPREVVVVVTGPGGLDPRILGGEGSGPAEYTFPIGLMRFPADTLVVVDRGNMRFLRILPSGEPGEVLNFGVIGGGAGIGSLPTATDTLGAVYAQGSAFRLSSAMVGIADSVPILRWMVGEQRRDTVAWVSSKRFPLGRGGGNLPFSTTTLWAVAEDGKIALIHPDPYRVTLIQPGGDRREGPPVQYDQVRVTEGHKESWRERLRPTARVVRGRPGATWSMERTGQEEPASWPRFLPPFQSLAVFAPDGRLWVERTKPEEEPPLFDVFDDSCRVVEQIRLPVGTRLVGFGRQAVFLARRDEVGIEVVEGYPFPMGM